MWNEPCVVAVCSKGGARSEDSEAAADESCVSAADDAAQGGLRERPWLHHEQDRHSQQDQQHSAARNGYQHRYFFLFFNM